MSEFVYIFVLTLHAFGADFVDLETLMDGLETVCSEAHPKSYLEHKPMRGGERVRCIINWEDLEGEGENVYLEASKWPVGPSEDPPKG